MPGPGDADTPAVTVVVPLLDAADRLPALHRELRRAGAGLAGPVEIVLVDDGSTDASWATIQDLAQSDPLVLGVRLAGNVGQVGALCAGFSMARAPIVAMVDDDLETDPAALVDLVAAVRAGACFASGRRRGTRPSVRAAGSWLYNARLRSWGLPFHDAGCGANAMEAALAEQLVHRSREIRQHRFKPAVAALTDRIVEIDVATGPPTPSHFRLLDLAASWLDIEAHVGGADLRRVAGAGVGLPLVVSLGAGLAAASRRKGTGGRSWGPALAGTSLLAAAVAASAGSVLLRTARGRRQARSGPDWQIAATAPTAP